VIPIDNYYHYHHYDHHDNNKLSDGAIVGIIFGVFVLFLLLCVPLIVVCVRRYRKKQRSPAYVALQQRYPRILQATGSNDVVFDSEPCGVKYNKFTDECSIENTPTNSGDTELSPDNNNNTKDDAPTDDI